MDKQTDRKTYIKQENLPVGLTKRLQDSILNNNKLEYRTKNNFLQCISIIYYHQVTLGYGLNNYVPLGRNFWKEIYGGNYHAKVIQPLLDEYKIIESMDFGYRTFSQNSKHITKGKQKGLVGIRYRINPDLLDDKFEAVSYINEGKVLTAMERMQLNKQEFVKPIIPDLNFNVTINHEKATTWIENNAEHICNEFLKRDYIDTIPNGIKVECKELIEISGNWSYNIQYRSVEAAKVVAETKNKEFFYFKDTFYIAEVNDFLKQRVAVMKYHYKHQISQIGVLPIEEKRSPITLRIYSQLTNFPSKILQFININNKTVVQLDLRTSQFLLFANLLNIYTSQGEQHLISLFKRKKTISYLKRLTSVLNKHQKQLPTVAVDISDSKSGQFGLSDTTKFIRDVFFTDFYGVVQHELGLKERLLAKHVLFKLLFKKTNRPDEMLSKLSHRYPVVMSVIADFKTRDAGHSAIKKPKNKDEDNNNFSVFLQCVESEIFVDNILKKLRKEKIPCFTRHDSIVVASGYEERAEEIAKQVFKDFGFRYNHTVDDKFWEVVDEDELEDSGYMQWLMDENELNTEYYEDENIKEQDDDESNNYDMEEHEIELMQKLVEIGNRDDYYEIVNTELLEELTLMPFLNHTQRNVLYDEINNQNGGICFFQIETNQLLKQIIAIGDNILDEYR